MLRQHHAGEHRLDREQQQRAGEHRNREGDQHELRLRRDWRARRLVRGIHTEVRCDKAAGRVRGSFAAQRIARPKGQSTGRRSGRSADLRRRHHRRRPQRPRLRRLSGAGRTQGDRAGAARCRRRRGGDRGIPSGLPQLGRRLHGLAAQPEGHPRSRACRAWPARSSSGQLHNFLPLARRALSEGRRRASTRAEVAKFSTPRCRAARRLRARLDAVADVLRALVLRDAAERGRGPAARGDRRARCKSGRHRQAAAPARHRRCNATCSTCSPTRPATISTAGSRASRSRPRYGFDGVVGNYASPYTPGSAYVLLHHVLRRGERQEGRVGPRDRRHGRDHAGDGEGARSRAASRSDVDAPRARGDRRDGPRGRRRDRRRASDRARARVVSNLNPKLLFERLIDRAGAADADSRERIDELALRLRHVPHERRARRSCRDFTLPAGRELRRSSHRRHHHRADARLHGARLFRRAHARLVARADRRDADPVDARRHARAAGAARREPVLPARRAGTAGRGVMGRSSRRRSPT